jgi:hypothetical protein
MARDWDGIDAERETEQCEKEKGRRQTLGVSTESRVCER